MKRRLRGWLRTLMPFSFPVACALAQSSCTCAEEPAPTPPLVVVPCAAQGKTCPAAPPLDTKTKTITTGAIPGGFSLSGRGGATYQMRLEPVPGRKRFEPDLTLGYTSQGGESAIGVGFSTSESSSIHRCASNLALDGEIRDVRYDAKDRLCLDGLPLVVVRDAPGVLEYRTLPNTLVNVIGHFPPDAIEKTPNNAMYFEAHLPSGLVVEYGNGGGRPLAVGGVPRTFLKTKVRDGRGNAMAYSYCMADRNGYTAEYALTKIAYTGFEGSPSIEPAADVRFVYSSLSKDESRIHYDRGMALQSSLRLDEIQMHGPGDSLVRRYILGHDRSPTTNRMRLISVEECGADGACKPPTRFQYKTDAPGFKRINTSITAPTSTLASPMLFDMTGDGLDDLVIPDTDAALSTPEHPVTNWVLAKNMGEGAASPYFENKKFVFFEDWPIVANPTGRADVSLLQPELGTVIDYNSDGKGDVLLHDVYGTTTKEIVLLAAPNEKFEKLETDIPRPFPLAAPAPPPALSTPGASIHLLDLNGDGVADRLECVDHNVDPVTPPDAPVWKVRLWLPAKDGTPAGFAITSEAIEPLAGTACNTHVHTVDIDGDGKTELIAPAILKTGGSENVPKLTYNAIHRLSDGTYETSDLKLPVQRVGGRTLFADINGDRLPDVVQSGWSDHVLRTYINNGATFESKRDSLAWDGIGEQDTYFKLAVPLDFNADGMTDLLVPLPGGVAPNLHSSLPRWFVLRATGALEGPAFVGVDAAIPFEAQLGDVITLADPRGARIGDLNGDGATDVLLLVDSVFTIFQSLAADQDVLVGVADGMNEHEPEDPGFVPSVSISYDHLIDRWMTNGSDPADPARESYLYLSHANPANDCEYPRRCAVGPRRVVSGYSLKDGEGGQRRFGVRYRDGRYHQLGLGDLGFEERIVTDLETGASTADLYDNQTSIEVGAAVVFPFARQSIKQWRWYPALPGQPSPGPLEIFFTDATPAIIPTDEGLTYLAAPTKRRLRRVQGTYPPPQDPSKSVEAYVADVEAKGGASVLRDTTLTISELDDFGQALIADVSTVGLDLTLHIERTVKHDTDRWVLGQLTWQKECSSASMLTRCRTLTRTTTEYGEIATEKVESEPKSAEAELEHTYLRDAFGNVTDVIADDAFGHHRASHTEYDSQGIFPVSYTNAAGHVTVVDFDPALGVLRKQIDPNQLLTTMVYDSVGRLERVERPEGSVTTITRKRTKSAEGWRVTEQTATTGGDDEVIELDSLGRPIRILAHGPDTVEQAGAPPRVMQIIGYDRLSGNVARRSVPVSEDTPEGQIPFDAFEFDALGREVRHVTPWNAATTRIYKGLSEEITDPHSNVTIVEKDALERPVTITDVMKGNTKYSYGPFETLYTVTDPSGAVTRTTRDALGRVSTLEEPDRGTTLQVHNGFSELESSTDQLGRHIEFEVDELGRTTSRTDKNGAETLVTTWTWDTAPHGIGELHTLASSDALKTYAYNARGQLESLTLSVNGAPEGLTAGYTYDFVGRVATISYPAPKGSPPFGVVQEYDAFGHLIAVRDSATNAAYWRPTAVDGAGRYQSEAFGNGVTTDRSYFADRQALKSITTKRGLASLQLLSFEYDELANLKSRKDALQPQNTTERFRYDPLERLTCAYFSVQEDPLVPCAQSFSYAPNGNMTFKSDVGVLTYADPKHPHAVTSAGVDSFSYNAVGNQITRPGGTTITYSPFDLPTSIVQGASSTTFAYDGDQARVRKTTPTEETLYLGDLYERVTDLASASVEHRYFVRSPERVVAIVTRGGKSPGTRYPLVDHLGSVVALTDESGMLDEPRSYDAFGQRRNPLWGQPPPASFGNKTTKGFTGHEADHELGLINMKGRIFDPKIGRFLTTDPVVPNLYSGQSFNSYAYVFNNPLTLVDPTGFEPNGPSPVLGELIMVYGYDEPTVPDVPGPSDDPALYGARGGSNDVGVTGDSPVDGTGQPGRLTLDDIRGNPYVQLEGGFLAGLSLALVPFGPPTKQALDPTQLLPSGTRNAQIGYSIGLFVGGMVSLLGGVGGGALSIGATSTGAGAAAGVPGLVISAGAVANGILTIGAGVTALSNAAMMSNSSGSSGPPQTAPTAKPGPTEPYNRGKHYGRTPSEADRQAVGAGQGQVADHDPPLVKRYYEGDPAKGEKPGWQMTPEERAASASDRSRMHPQSRPESNSQGGQMRAYSQDQKKANGL